MTSWVCIFCMELRLAQTQYKGFVSIPCHFYWIGWNMTSITELIGYIILAFQMESILNTLFDKAVCWIKRLKDCKCLCYSGLGKNNVYIHCVYYYSIPVKNQFFRMEKESVQHLFFPFLSSFLLFMWLVALYHTSHWMRRPSVTPLGQNSSHSSGSDVL